MLNDQETDVVATEIQEPTEAVQEVAEPEKVQEPKEEHPNWRVLREKAERAEREMARIQKERDEMQKLLESYQTPKPKEEEEEIRINPDELVEGKHLTRYEKKLKKIEQTLAEQAQKTQQVTAEARIRSEFPEFDKVVTEETLYILRTQFPELASSINANPDLYSKAKAAHQAIVKLGLAPDSSTEQVILDKNQAKPKPISSIAPGQGSSPLSQANAFANGLTDELKKQLYKEALDAINSR